MWVGLGSTLIFRPETPHFNLLTQQKKTLKWKDPSQRRGWERGALRIQIRDAGAHISYEFQREQKWITLLHLGKCPKRTCSTLECSNRLQDVPLCGTRLAIHKCEGHNSNSGKNEGAEKEGLRRCGTRWNIIRGCVSISEMDRRSPDPRKGGKGSFHRN